MKKYAVWLLLFLLLTGCSGPPDEMEVGLELRSRLLQGSACSFDACINADYEDKIHSFTMHCEADSKGDVTFSVVKPDSISGISGKMTGDGGKLIFADIALSFEPMAEQLLSPISAPWILMKTLRSGYMTSACEEAGKIRLSIDDSYEENALRLDILLNAANEPEFAEILYKGRKILSVAVENFEIL